MHIEIDTSVDAAHVTVADRDVDRTVEVDERRRMDYAADGALVGLEFLDSTRGVDLQGLPFQRELEQLFGEQHIPSYAR